MSFRRIVSRALIVAAVCAAPALAQNVPSRDILRNAVVTGDWHWIWAGPGATDSWDTRQGIAKNVVFQNGKFSADLYSVDLKRYPGAGQDIHLEGRINNGKIVATETLLNTDAPPLTYRGHLDLIRPQGDPQGVDRIVLTNAASFLGLVRDVQVGPAVCPPICPGDKH